MTLRTACTVLVALSLSCGDATLPPLPETPATTLGVPEGRPATVRVPSDYDPGRFYPLIVLLHGYAASGPVQNIYFGLSSQVNQRDFLLVIPNGTLDSSESRFWDATDACCNFEDRPVDDVAYLRGLITEAQENYRIDPERVYLLGHSNGGFMSYRMACEAPDMIAAIASLAGATHFDAADCAADEPVSVLQIHGTADQTILYDGETDGAGSRLGGYPSAPESARRWAARAGCDLDAADAGADRDFDFSVDGAETSVLEYRSGCRNGVDAALWTIQEGEHLPVLDRTTFTPAVVDWLLAHHR